MSLYSITITERRGWLYVEQRCETCDEVYRLVLADEQLDAIRVLASPLGAVVFGQRETPLPDAASLAAASAAPQVVRAFVWQLTHATAHVEAERFANVH